MSKFDFVEIPKEQWPPRHSDHLEKVFKSSDFLVQQYLEPTGHIRLSVNKIKRKAGGWEENITWDQLQLIKSRVGFENDWAVEIYPKSSSVVNVANMRHLFVLTDKPAFAWGKA